MTITENEAYEMYVDGEWVEFMDFDEFKRRLVRLGVNII